VAILGTTRIQKTEINMLNRQEAAEMMQLHVHAVKKLVEAGELSDHEGKGFLPEECGEIKSQIHMLEFYHHMPDKIRKWEDLALVNKDIKLRARRPAVKRNSA
jgi:polyhydroxyalkanoate synthesis regulator phasin